MADTGVRQHMSQETTAQLILYERSAVQLDMCRMRAETHHAADSTSAQATFAAGL